MYGYENMTMQELMDELKKEYRELSKKWYPDFKPLEKREKFTRRMQWLNNKYGNYIHVSPEKKSGER